jgi:hypothetical protein
MTHLRCLQLTYLSFALGLAVLSGCLPVSRPTLDQVRLGQGRGASASDTVLRPGEIRAEVTEIDPSRREIRARTEDGKTQVLAYDVNRTRVTYHERDYRIDHLEAGDLIALETSSRSSNFVDRIRIQEPVQARTGSTVAGRSPLPPPRADVIEGTVERVDYDLGVFDVNGENGDGIGSLQCQGGRRGELSALAQGRLCESRRAVCESRQSATPSVPSAIRSLASSAAPQGPSGAALRH